ncbi:FAD-dependent oxidoreductase [soil metagenome]
MYDFFIVGHGLAGAILARTLRLRGHRVMVIDQPKANSASNVAAGLMNPVAGKRFAKSWQADLFLPAAHTFYSHLEVALGERFFFPSPIVKLFSTPEEQNNWMAKSADPGWEGLVETPLPGQLPDSDAVVQQEYGGIIVRQGGHVEVRRMLEALQQDLKRQEGLLEGHFDLARLEIEGTFVRYETITASHLIFCEGFQASTNPYFGWLPFSLNKGEVLDVRVDNFKPQCIYNKGVYVLPLMSGEGLRVGATYDWRQVDEKCTDVAQAELSQKLGQVIWHPFEVKAQYAGIRPAVRDRRPLIGTHPDIPVLHIFNGMGSKGVMMAPYLARHFAEVLEGERQLLNEVNICRYFPLYYENRKPQ